MSKSDAIKSGGSVSAFLYAVPCPSDVNGDDETTVDDLVAIILAWGTDDESADLDGDSIVGVDDLVMVILGWGACP